MDGISASEAQAVAVMQRQFTFDWNKRCLPISQSGWVDFGTLRFSQLEALGMVEQDLLVGMVEQDLLDGCVMGYRLTLAGFALAAELAQEAGT